MNSFPFEILLKSFSNSERPRFLRPTWKFGSEILLLLKISKALNAAKEELNLRFKASARGLLRLGVGKLK